MKGVSSSFKEVSGVFKRSLKGSMVFQGSLKIVNEVSRVLQESFEGSSRNFQGLFKEVSRAFQGRLKGVSKEF